MEIVELQNGQYSIRKFFFISFKHLIFFSWGYRNYSASEYHKHGTYWFKKHCIFNTYERALEVKNMREDSDNFKIKRICG